MVSEIKGGLTAVPGFRTAGVEAGIKNGGPDLFLLASDRGPVPAAGLFTSNRVEAAPVQVSKSHLDDKELGAVVANSGCANAFTGREGVRKARRMAEAAAEALNLRTDEVGVASTGRIGSPLPIEKVEEGVKKAEEELSNSWESGTRAAKALTTTDTKVKEIAVKMEEEDGTEVTIGGAAKGSGMVHPDLHATMLGIIVTDAEMSAAGLRTSLQRAADQSFNLTTIDKDTSTNDTVFGLANGLAGNERITKKDPSENFQEGLDYVTRELAKMIARDGEGATHMIEVQVDGAKRKEEAKRAARKVAGSNLVKAAIFGKDPNWGRIIAALGNSGAEFTPSRISLSFIGGDREAPLVLKGESLPEDTAEGAKKVLEEEEIQIYIDLDEGDESATAWGCDLSKEYVEINSQYSAENLI